jgi:large subunit ribosomal protein L3
MPALLGRKIGMTRWFKEDGTNVPVTVIAAGPCVVTQIKRVDTDGYSAVQLGYDEVKPRRTTMPLIGHDAKAGTTPKRCHSELRMADDDAIADFELGQTVDVTNFQDVKYVDVTGTGKGKGFAGVMKRHNFRGLEASHGVERKHRSAGSIGGHATDLGTGPKVKKGKRMAGQMGNKRVTVRSLDIIAIDADRHLLMVKGPVPGPNQGFLYIRDAKRLNRSKTRKAAAK